MSFTPTALSLHSKSSGAASGQLRVHCRTHSGYKNSSRGFTEQIVSFSASSPDADGDGLLDSWEITHFGTTIGHSALNDFDHHGYNERRELALGLSPVAPNGGGLPPGNVEGGHFTVTITKQTGVTYAMKCKAKAPCCPLRRMPSTPRARRCNSTTPRR